MDTLAKYRLDGKVAIITGGAGLLGVKHAEAIAEAGGIPTLWDINKELVREKASEISEICHCTCLGIPVDITKEHDVKEGLNKTIEAVHRVDILINNAANDPKIEPGKHPAWSRVENFETDIWNKDIEVGLTGAFLCSKHVGSIMAKNRKGVILNIASDLGLIAPDQRIYRQDDLSEAKQPVKPITYSVIKHAIIGLTKYLASYWAHHNIRVNALSPGGVFNNQPDPFVFKLTNLIPMNRMANLDEYKAAVLFLVSDASSYMTGANLVVDGGRTCW